jgi:hypothetical protein
MNATTVRCCGAAVAVGGITWGATWWFSPSVPGENSQVEIWASGAFQLGLFALLAVMWTTRATGTGRWSRLVLASEGVAVLLASSWTVPYLADANRPSTGLLAVLDPFWPLSMTGLIVVGVLVVLSRRWPAPTRYLPLAASLVIPIDIAMSWAPVAVRDAFIPLYLAFAYGLLGISMVLQADSLGRAATAPAVVVSANPTPPPHSPARG